MSGSVFLMGCRNPFIVRLKKTLKTPTKEVGGLQNIKNMHTI